MATDDPNYPQLGTNDPPPSHASAPPPAYNQAANDAPPAYNQSASDAPPGYNPNAPSAGETYAPPPGYNPNAPTISVAANAPPPGYNPNAPSVQPQYLQQGIPQQQVVYQQPQQVALPQGATPQQVMYQNPAPQMVVQQPPQQQQQQVIYVNQFGQQIAAPQQQQVQYTQMQPAGSATAAPAASALPNQVVVPQTSSVNGGVMYKGGGVVPVVANATIKNPQQRPDDPTCLYIFAFLSLLIWPIGIIGMLIYSCGSGLPPRQSNAFKILCVATLIGIVVTIALMA